MYGGLRARWEVIPRRILKGSVENRMYGLSNGREMTGLVLLALYHGCYYLKTFPLGTDLPLLLSQKLCLSKVTLFCMNARPFRRHDFAQLTVYLQKSIYMGTCHLVSSIQVRYWQL